MADVSTKTPRFARCAHINDRFVIYDASHGPDVEITFYHADESTVQMEQMLRQLLEVLPDTTRLVFNGTNTFQTLTDGPAPASRHTGVLTNDA